MNHDASIKEVMGKVLGVGPDQLNEQASADNIDTWDSLRHMNLILALEEEFGVVIPDEDAPNITSFSLIRLVIGELKET